MSRIIRSADVRRAIQAARRHVDPARRFGVGGSCNGRTGSGRRGTGACGSGISMPDIPGCEPDPGRYCDMQKIGKIVEVNGQAAFIAVIEPEQTPFFDPRAVRATVTDASNPDLNHRVFITGVSINKYPQELFHDAAPTAATLDGIWSDDWTDPDGYAVKVPWGFMSNEANNLVLEIYGFVRGYSAGTSLEVQFTVYGNGLRKLPDWVDERTCHHPRHNMPAAA